MDERPGWRCKLGGLDEMTRDQVRLRQNKAAEKAVAETQISTQKLIAVANTMLTTNNLVPYIRIHVGVTPPSDTTALWLDTN